MYYGLGLRGWEWNGKCVERENLINRVAVVSRYPQPIDNAYHPYYTEFQQIQHPTASLIARVATAQDDVTGDGTTSNVLLIGELLKQADVFISEVIKASTVSQVEGER